MNGNEIKTTKTDDKATVDKTLRSAASNGALKEIGGTSGIVVGYNFLGCTDDGAQTLWIGEIDGVFGEIKQAGDAYIAIGSSRRKHEDGPKKNLEATTTDGGHTWTVKNLTIDWLIKTIAGCADENKKHELALWGKGTFGRNFS